MNPFRHRSAPLLRVAITWVAGSLVALAATAPAAVRPVVLKHRVEVVAPFAAAAERQGVDVTIEANGTRPGVGTDGVAIQRDEWASALDELKLMLGQSAVFRPVDPPEHAAPTAGKALPEVRLVARFSRAGAEVRVLLRLVQTADGALVAATEGRGDGLPAAIAPALAKLEKEMLRRPWRCRITERIDRRLVISYGRLDGLQSGQVLVGFVLKEDARAPQTGISDLVMLTSARKAGTYQVSEVTEELALLEPVADSPLLSPGDVMEAPAPSLLDLPRSSPSTLWDRVYDNR